MSQGRHPDFFEVDAASHAGVDMIRQLIDSSQFLPVMGHKKIYLIDEAHMLSKASFNALLKILEEPPASVLFMLATTDVHKIIDTVRSRCFQLFFTAIPQDHIYQHLSAVCIKEDISIDDQALQLIALHADGSLRDALNLLEQIRFSSGTVTQQAVLAVLGYLDDAQVITLVEKVCRATPADLLSYMQQIRLESYSPERVWERLVACIRAIVWIKHGAKPQEYMQYESRIKRILADCPWSVVSLLGERLHSEHILFHKSTTQYALLEMILVHACSVNGSTTTGTAGAAAQAAPGSAVLRESSDQEQVSDQSIIDENEPEDVSISWSRFVRDGRLEDPIRSILQHGRCVACTHGEVVVEFSKQFSFFQDMVTSTQAQWGHILRAVFGPQATLKAVFTAPEIPKQSLPVVSVSKPVAQSTKEAVVNIAQTVDAWPLAHIVVRQFPGTITEIGDTTHV
jgi:DNA polymerase-3 subunit gamma/tau